MWKEEKSPDTRSVDDNVEASSDNKSDDVVVRSENGSPSRSATHSRSHSRSQSRSRSRSRSRRARSRSRRSRRNSGRFSRRDDPEPSRCLGVFGLSLYTTERDLKELFSQYGEVENVQLVFDHPTGRSRGFGFVYFEKLEDAMLAKDRVAGTEIDGHKVRVDFSITKRAHTPTPGIYMGAPDQRRSRRYRRSPSSRRGYRSRYRSPPRDYYRYHGNYDDRYDRYSPYRSTAYYRRSPSPRYYDDRRRRRSRSYDRDREYY
ncbi:unnamed protein product [Enterobius vermicularis]|uniref:RRM domain-containing protein n=1 Tax=Enterobius vermicularis TaxID=51028 RepID=A0A0N4VEN5_ENTVE|nr:unnamed protein product [Enterobius vermicularis]